MEIPWFIVLDMYLQIFFYLNLGVTIYVHMTQTWLDTTFFRVNMNMIKIQKPKHEHEHDGFQVDTTRRHDPETQRGTMMQFWTSPTFQ